MNRAIDGDKVAVQILPESRWRAPEGRYRTREVDEEKETAEEAANAEQTKLKTAAAKAKPSAKVVKTGKIVSILQRQLKHYCGILEPPDRKSWFARARVCKLLFHLRLQMVAIAFFGPPTVVCRVFALKRAHIKRRSQKKFSVQLCAGLLTLGFRKAR